MSATTQIEWTDATWNPVTGCTKITRGCDICYAERFSERFRGVVGHPFENGFELTLRPERLTQPLSWKQPRRVFVNSMSDLFHKEIPKPFVDSVFETMEAADWHTFQVLTKRSSLMTRYLRGRYERKKAPAHIWLGVSIEDAQNAVRLKHLRAAQASIKFISFEPLLGPIGSLDLRDIDWVIVGGESGPRARPMAEEWALEIRDQCRRDKVAFFFKQWGGVRPKSGGRLLRGREWNEYPRVPMEADADRYRWEVNFGLKYCCMKLDGNTGDDVVPLLSIGFFTASSTPEGALESREALLTSVLRALGSVSSSLGVGRDDVAAA